VVAEHSGSAAGAMQLGAAAASPVGGLMPAVVVAPPIEIRVWGGGDFTPLAVEEVGGSGETGGGWWCGGAVGAPPRPQVADGWG
jgi:hypothetical protein